MQHAGAGAADGIQHDGRIADVIGEHQHQPRVEAAAVVVREPRVRVQQRRIDVVAVLAEARRRIEARPPCINDSPTGYSAGFQRHASCQPRPAWLYQRAVS